MDADAKTPTAGACSRAAAGSETCPHCLEAKHERLKELCAVIEPWASHHACNNRSVSKLADDVYRACVEMRRIIYSPNAQRERPAEDGK